MSVAEIFPVTLEEKLTITRALHRTDEEMKNDVKMLKEWLEKQQHLPKCADDCFLEKLLRLNKGSLEKTKKKLDMYYSTKTLVPDAFNNRNVFSSKMQKFMECVHYFPYPKLTRDANRIIIYKIVDPDPDNFDLNAQFNYTLAMHDLCLHYDQAENEVGVVDCSNVSFGHVTKFNPAAIKKILMLITKAYSTRFKGFHILHLPPAQAAILTLVKHLLKDKMASRVMGHNDFGSLHKVVQKEDLPSDFGGDQMSIADAFAQWKKFMESKNDWLLEQAQLQSDEKLRIGDPLDGDIFGGMHGSFRTLNVD